MNRKQRRTQAAQNKNPENKKPEENSSVDFKGLFEQGKTYFEDGEIDKALEIFAGILRIKPDYVPAIEGMGIAMAQKGFPERAIHYFRLITEHHPDYAVGHSNYGETLMRLEYFKEAETHIGKACALDPDNIEHIMQNAEILLAKGDLDGSRSLVKRVMEIDPEKLGAYVSYVANMHRVQDEEDPYFKKLHEFAGQYAKENDNDDDARHKLSMAYSALAKCYNDLGEYDKAFDYQKQSSEIRRSMLEYNVHETKKEFDELKAYFTFDVFFKYQTLGYKSKKPVFIMGMPRSGTTLLEQILHSHSQIVGIGESSKFLNIVRDHAVMPMENGQHFPYSESGHITQDPYTPEQIGKAYVDYIEERAPGAQRVVNKAITNVAYFGAAKLFLPDASYVHIKRNPLDSAISTYFQNFRSTSQPYSYDLYELGLQYRYYNELFEHWERILPPGSMLTITYEDLVNDFEKQAMRVIDYLGLEWEEACTQFYNTEKYVRTASVTQVRQPIYKTSLDKWRRYRKHLKPLVEALGDYAPEDARKEYGLL